MRFFFSHACSSASSRVETITRAAGSSPSAATAHRLSPPATRSVSPRRSRAATARRLAQSRLQRSLLTLVQLAFLMSTTSVKRVCTTSWSSTCSVPVWRISSTTAIAGSLSRPSSWLPSRWCVLRALRLDYELTWPTAVSRPNYPREEPHLP